jgi:hypothetical protein
VFAASRNGCLKPINKGKFDVIMHTKCMHHAYPD